MDIEEIIPKDNRIIAEEKKYQGDDEYKAQNYKTALKYYSDAITLSPETAVYYENRSTCHMMLGDYRAALQDARHSIQIDDKFEQGFIRMAECCLALDDIFGSEQSIKKLLDIEPNYIAIKMGKANLQQFEDIIQLNYDKKIFGTAVYFLDRALKMAPSYQKYKLIKAECLVYLGRLDEASDIAVNVMKIDSTSAGAIYIRGLCLYYRGNLGKSILHFEYTIRLDPDHTKAKEMRTKLKKIKDKNDRGNNLFKSGKYRDALTIYTESFDIDPFDQDMNCKIYYNRALINSKLGNLSESITDCTRVLDINAQYLKALLLRAKCYNDLENYDECVNDYEAAFKLQKTQDIANLLRDAKIKKSKPKDYYQMLGVTKHASEAEIKKAYREKALALHPDKHANISDHYMKEINKVYEVLSNPEKKMLYDSGKRNDFKF